MVGLRWTAPAVAALVADAGEKLYQADFTFVQTLHLTCPLNTVLPYYRFSVDRVLPNLA